MQNIQYRPVYNIFIYIYILYNKFQLTHFFSDHDNNGTIEKRNGTRPNSSLSESKYTLSCLNSRHINVHLMLMSAIKGSSSSGRLSTVSGGSVGETNSVQSEMDDKTRSIVSIPLNMPYCIYQS